MSELRDEVANDPNYRLCLDNGFVGIVDHMGTDNAIVQAARVSYGVGTKSVNEDRGLIRYLLRHIHTTPFEMCEIKFRVRAPIFVARQWLRHRSANVNEESARYSIMRNEFYFPDFEDILPQSKDNKQGRAGEMSDFNRRGVLEAMKVSYENSNTAYRLLMGEKDDEVRNWYGPYDTTDPWFEDDFEGTARELARSVMPVGTYTTFYYKQDLWNLMHFLRLRMDGHAQKEIRVYGEAMYDLIKPLFPVAVEAFDDYIRHSTRLSRMETEFLQELLTSVRPVREKFDELLRISGDVKGLAKARGMSPREMRDFMTKWKLGDAE